MPKSTGVMIDLETLGLDDDTKIIQVGMVSFNPDTFEPIDTFLMNVDPELQPNRSTTKSTLKFWAEQPKAVQKSVLSNPQEPSLVAAEMVKWIEDQPGQVELWCNHLLFDVNKGNSFLMEFANRTLTDDLVKFYLLLDYATLVHVIAKKVGGRMAFKEMAMDEYEKALAGEVHLTHNALDDCLYQLHTLKLIMEAIG